MVEIGKIKLRSRLLLAPMAGVTDAPFRAICNEHGCGLAYTEMISAKALMYNDRKTKELLRKADEEPEPAVQIFGSEPDAIKYAVDYLSGTGTPLIDINMGCPAPKIVRNGDGSALMKDPEKARLVMTAAVDNTDKPVTVKIRSGWSPKSINAVDISIIAEESGVSAVAVHPRTRDMFYSGRADWNIISEIKDKLSIPVIGGGDILCAEDAVRMMEGTGCDAVMAARGAMGNPWIFSDYNNLAGGREIEQVSVEERMETLRRQFDLMLKYKGEHIAVLEIRKHASWYIKGMYGASELKRQIYATRSVGEVCEKIDEFIELSKNR